MPDSRRGHACTSLGDCGNVSVTMSSAHEIGPQWHVTLAVLAIGALLALPYVIRVLASAINTDVLATVLAKLLSSDNPTRAIKLTLAAPQSPHCAAVRAALYACRDSGAFRPVEQADYRRGAFETAPPQILAVVRARYDEAFDLAVRPVVRTRIPAALAVVALLAAVVSPVLLGEVPAVLPSIGGFGLLVIAFAARGDWRMFNSRNGLFQSLGEQFTRLALKPELFAQEAPTPSFEYHR